MMLTAKGSRSPMRVLLLGNYADNRNQSMRRFAVLLKEGLSKANCEVRLLHPPTVFGNLRPNPTGLGKWLGYIDRLILFPFHLKREMGWADVVHICDHANAVYVPMLKHKPHVLTCHDVLNRAA